MDVSFMILHFFNCTLAAVIALYSLPINCIYTLPINCIMKRHHLEFIHYRPSTPFQHSEYINSIKIALSNPDLIFCEYWKCIYLFSFTITFGCWINYKVIRYSIIYLVVKNSLHFWQMNKMLQISANFSRYDMTCTEF